MVQLRTAVSGVLLALGFACAPPAHATFAGTNGSIAYVVEGPAGARRIESAFLGTEGALVPDLDMLQSANVNRGGDAFDPAFSADGHKLLFVSTRSGRREIYSSVLGFAGVGSTPAGTSATCPAEPCLLSGGPGESYEPAWAPDGKSIVFVSTREGSPQIYRMTAAGEGVSRLTVDGAVDQAPTWSQTGMLAFVGSASGLPEIYTMSGRGEELRQLTSGSASASPSWSPAGTELAYVRQTSADNQVFVAPVPAAGPNGGAKQLTSAGPESRMAVWSPDGTKLVVTRAPGPGAHTYFETIDARSGVTISRQPSLGGGEARSWAALPPAPPKSAAQPSAGVSAIARPLSGKVDVNPTHPVASAVPGGLPGAGSESTEATPASRLTQSVEVPVNSTYNATRGEVMLTVVGGAAQRTSTAIVSGGRFRLVQRASGDVPTIRLLGKPQGCHRHGRAAAASRRRRQPRVRGHTKGDYHQAAGDTTAGTRSTIWEVRETCRGVLWRAIEHSLWVHDPHRRGIVQVRQGHSYLVRPGR